MNNYIYARVWFADDAPLTSKKVLEPIPIVQSFSSRGYEDSDHHREFFNSKGAHLLHYDEILELIVGLPNEVLDRLPVGAVIAFDTNQAKFRIVESGHHPVANTPVRIVVTTRESAFRVLPDIWKDLDAPVAFDASFKNEVESNSDVPVIFLPPDDEVNQFLVRNMEVRRELSVTEQVGEMRTAPDSRHRKFKHVLPVADKVEERKGPTFIDSLKKRGRDKRFEELKNQGFLFNEEKFWLLVRNIKRQVPTLLTGPSGVGKTTIASKVAEVANMKFHTIQMSAALDPVSYLLGVHRLSGGNSYFQMAPFAKASMEKNNLILLDEVNRCPPSGANILFPALDFQRTLNLDLMDDENLRSVPVGDQTTYLATANIGHNFSGTHSIDTALNDRFMRIEIDFPSQEEEIELVATRSKLSKRASYLLVDAIRQIRQLLTEYDAPFSPSVRASVEIASLVADGYDLRKSVEFYVFPHTEEDVREIITNKLQRL